MTDTGWTFEGRRVIESENAPDPNRIKHLGTRTSDHSPFLSRIVNTCDLHGAILDVTDPIQNMRAAYDYHTRRSVNTSKERTMTGKDFADHLLDAITDEEDGLGYFWIDPATRSNTATLSFSDGLVTIDYFRAVVERAIDAYDDTLLEEAFDDHDRWEAGYDDGMRDGINLAIKQVEAIKP